jgi:hypothetical protein
MSWNLDQQGSFGCTREKAAQLFLKRGVGVIHEAVGIELNAHEFGIGALNVLEKIHQRWETIPVATTHPDSTINYLVTIGVAKWVQNIKRPTDSLGKQEEPLDLKKIHKSFEDIASVVTSLFPTFPGDSMQRIEECSGIVCSQIEKKAGLWTRDFRNKAATLLTLHPLVYSWATREKELSPVCEAFQDIFPGPVAK